VVDIIGPAWSSLSSLGNRARHENIQAEIHNIRDGRGGFDGSWWSLPFARIGFTSFIQLLVGFGGGPPQSFQWLAITSEVCGGQEGTGSC
jgi:hypothetical protein